MSLLNDTYIIAEVGVNHNGSIDLAKQLVEAAAKAGADAVKFQTFKANKGITEHAKKAPYQNLTTNSYESQIEMIRGLELTKEDHIDLVKHCEKHGIDFLSSPKDLDSLHLIYNVVNMSKIKIGSGEVTNAPLLLEIAKYDKPVILSTGMSTLGDIEVALGVLAFGYLKIKKLPSIKSFREAYYSSEGFDALKEKVILLHCNTDYPTPYEDVNLRAMDTLAISFGLQVGYSDHAPCINLVIAAVAKGAKVIEKHITLSKEMKGPDHSASIEIDELNNMVIAIRNVEKALGSGVKVPSPSELKNIDIVRRSIVAEEQIKKGEYYSDKNLAIKRPGLGMAPIKYWNLIGKKADKDYEKDDYIWGCQ